MSMTLAEALEQVHLEPGRTYRERVDGKTVEVRVIADPAADEAVPDGPPYLQLAITFPLDGDHVLAARKRQEKGKR